MDVVVAYEKLDRLIHSFYTLTKYRIAFYDTSFRKIISYPKEECAFCNAIHSMKGGLEACQKSDEDAFQHCLRNDDLYIFPCHAGLTEAAISLKSDGVIVGHIMFGQITRDQDKKERFQKLVHSLDGLSASMDEKRKMTDAITYQEDGQIQAASVILLACGKYAISAKLFSVKQDEFIEKVDAIIVGNITKRITSGFIARQLNISRTELYRLSNEYLKKGIGSYLQQKRLEKACELLFTSLSIEEVSEQSGFSDYNYFERVFKRKIGLSASQYRKNHRK